MANCQCPECSCTAWTPDERDPPSCDACNADNHAGTTRDGEPREA